MKILNAWAPFDIVFAMSVLCAWPHSRDLPEISGLYKFSEFEENVSLLDGLLRKGSLLVIWNASFRFTDTHISERYESMPIPNISESGFVKKFGADNMELEKQDYRLFIFRKVR